MRIFQRAMINDSPRFDLNAFFLGIASLLFFSLIFCSLYEFWINTPLGPDAGYYLMKSLQILDGFVPYRDIEIMHPFGTFYIHALLFKCLGVSRIIANSELLVCHLIIAMLVGLAASRISTSPVLSALIAGSIYLLNVPVFEGFYFVIEPLVSIFGWLAIHSAISLSRGKCSDNDLLLLVRLLLTGALIGISVACKQVGILFSLPVIGIIAKSHVKKFKMWSAFGVGVLTPFLAFASVYPDAVIPAINQNFFLLARYAAGTYSVHNDPWSSTLWRFLENGIFWMPVIVALTVTKFVAIDLKNEMLVTLIRSIFASGVLLFAPTLMRPHLHYYLLGLPFTGLAIALICSRALCHSRAALYGTLAAASVFFLILGPFQRSEEVVADYSRRKVEEDAIANWIKRSTLQSSKIMILPDSPQFYFLVFKRGAVTDYNFFPTPEHYEMAATGHVPVFVVDRGNANQEKVRQELKNRGLIVVDNFYYAERWELDPLVNRMLPK